MTRATGGAPVKLKVANAEKNVNFTVDLVPAFAFDLSVLKDACSELFIRVKNMIKDYQISPEKAKVKRYKTLNKIIITFYSLVLYAHRDQES